VTPEVGQKKEKRNEPVEGGKNEEENKVCHHHNRLLLTKTDKGIERGGQWKKDRGKY